MIGEQPHPKRCFIISEEDFEKFAQQMIVTFPFMPDPVRKEWADRIKRVRASRISAGEPAPDTISYERFKQTIDGVERECRKDERAKVLDKVFKIINKNCFEMEGKRLKITPLLLCKEIESLRQPELQK